MNEIPAKVVALVGLEAGLFVGLGVMLWHTARIVRAASASRGWESLRAIDPALARKAHRASK